MTHVPDQVKCISDGLHSKPAKETFTNQAEIVHGLTSFYKFPNCSSKSLAHGLYVPAHIWRALHQISCKQVCARQGRALSHGCFQLCTTVWQLVAQQLHFLQLRRLALALKALRGAWRRDQAKRYILQNTNGG